MGYGKEGVKLYTYTLEEVARHNTAQDCWLIINGKFLEDHPGGDEVLLSTTGKDATDDFEDIGHSTSARGMMDESCIGEIDASTIPTKVKYTPPKQPQYNQDKTSDFNNQAAAVHGSTDDFGPSCCCETVHQI